MERQRWSQVRRVVEEALDLDGPARAALLDRECGDDADLRAEVEELLSVDDEPGDLTAVVDVPPFPALVAAADLAPGTRVGRYRLVRLVASGGMGTVYEAEQDEPRRTVALKTLRIGLRSPAARSRFRYEAEILGRLSHPCIAQVYEAGTLGDDDGGVPWFAMEYVDDARPLIRAADERRLDVGERLVLFGKVCDAIHHGHQKGVVHRDLKPSNILVGPDGRPKVIDFGVARVLEEDGSSTLRTLDGQIVGTIQYMSPEQVSGTPGEVDTRSDVYALGLLLYELVTGRPPYDLSERSLTEAVRLVRDVEPPAPRSIARELPVDLDWIVRKALEKEKDRRYGTVAELAADIDRCRRHEPVLAGPPTTAYRLSRFVRRHRSGVVVGALLLISLVGGVVGTSLGFLEEREQRRIAEEQTALAEERRTEAEAATARAEEQTTLAEVRQREAEAATARAEEQRRLADERRLAEERQRRRAEASRDFLDSMFASVTGRRRGSDVRVVEILDDAAARIEREFRDDPLTEAELRGSLGAAYGWLGEYRKAEPQLRSALAIFEAELEEHDPRKLDVLDRLAIATTGTAESGTPGAVEAAELLIRSVDIAQREYGPAHDETLKAMVSLARHLYGPLGRLAEAESLLLQAWGRYVDRSGEPSAMETRILRRLAEATLRLDRVPDAERIYHAVIESAALRRGVTHSALPAVERGDKLERSAFPSSVVAADVLTAMLQEAIDAYDDDPRVTGELMELFSVSDGFFSILLHRAQRLGAQEDYVAAEPLLRAELELLTRVNGADHDTVTLTTTNLANTVAALGELDEAEALMRSAMDQMARQRGEDSTDFAKQRLGLAQIMRWQGRDDDAEVQVREALGTYERVMPPGSWLVAEMRVNHGISLRNCGRYEQAEAQLLEGYEGLRATLGDDHGQVLWARQEVVWLYEDWGRPEEVAAWSASAGP